MGVLSLDVKQSGTFLGYTIRFEVFLYGEVCNTYGASLCISIFVDLCKAWADFLKGVAIPKFASLIVTGVFPNLNGKSIDEFWYCQGFNSAAKNAKHLAGVVS